MILLLATLTDAEKLQAGMFVAFPVSLAACAAMWAWIFLRRRQGKPVIPLARRRPVPWRGQDVLFIFLMGLLLVLMASTIVNSWVGADAARPTDQKPELAHPAEQLLRSGQPAAIAVAAIMAVIVAPLVEEFLFRVLLQGWLEAVWSRHRRKYEVLRRPPLSWIPIVLPALLFASMHPRSSELPHTPQYLTIVFAGHLVAELATFGLAIAVLRLAAGATAADLGWNPAKLRWDAKYGLLALVAITPPVLMLQAGLTLLVTSTGVQYAPDPIPLFFLALVLGVLYRRTHRLAPSLVLHMAFNATAVGLLFAGK